MIFLKEYLIGKKYHDSVLTLSTLNDIFLLLLFLT